MTDLNQQIQELRSTLGKMEIALGSVDEGIVWTDNQGRIQWCNSTFDKLVKKIHILILGQQLTDLLILSQEGVTIDKKLHPVIQALETKSKGKDQYELQSDGCRLVLEISWSYLQMPNSVQQDHHIGSAVIVIHDITERKAAEIFLQQAKRELEQRVKERTQELMSVNRQLVEHNLALEEAKKRVESASKIKSEFLATMSHEIRTPLNAVIGLTELLLHTELDATQADFVSTIQSSGDMLLTLINDILNFSKIDTGQIELIEEPFDLKAVIDSSIDIINFQATSKKLQLNCLIESPIPNWIIGDSNRLSQILLNLLNNAVKFTESGEIEISLKSRTLNKLNKISPILLSATYELEFCIRDTGIGIPSSKINQLFQPFTQLDASMSRKYGGTGLGLAISKKLVEMMGGKIWVESKEGIGSKFFFTIIASEKTTLVAKNSQFTKDLTGKQILIVDANITNQQILIQQTQSWGMLNCAVSTGQQALNLITKGINFDLIIVELELLDMDAIYLIREIRQQFVLKEIPIVILSSPSQPEFNTSNTDLDAILVLQQPIQKSQLYESLQKIFTKKEIKVNQMANIVTSTKPTSTISKIDQNPPFRILLAEDNLVNQKVALLVLKQIGYHADVANNGLEVLEALQQQTYDVVLMDVQMPKMDGLAATQKICQQWSNSERPRIIALTANAMPGDREICLSAGMDDYITKPIRVENLKAALSKCQRTD